MDLIIHKVIHSLGKVFKSVTKLGYIFLLIMLVASCSTTPPKQLGDICDLFTEKRSWYKSALAMQKRWGTPIQVPMAMMYQESRFVSDARPPRTYLLGFIPWKRKSSAFGYSQAKTGTWNDYRRETGDWGADRDNFKDAINFMGWYTHKTHKVNGVSKWDARAQYLNYHEGWGGYRKRTYRKKDWLLKVADSIQQRAERYGAQYRGCEKRLKLSWWERLF